MVTSTPPDKTEVDCLVYVASTTELPHQRPATGAGMPDAKSTPAWVAKTLWPARRDDCPELPCQQRRH